VPEKQNEKNLAGGWRKIQIIIYVFTIDFSLSVISSGVSAARESAACFACTKTKHVLHDCNYVAVG
jgi:hypothetical protein